MSRRMKNKAKKVFMIIAGVIILLIVLLYGYLLVTA